MVPRAPPGTRVRSGAAPLNGGSPVLDLVYITGAIVLFALVGLVGRGVEKL
ncbi:hypothetical protein [Clavibacter michiganensis]|uniref:hypothetical protein n=1 Tax=Clavibacter michiganensis TaxID=28447 RepID=UPI001F25CD0E|nr:hypothetical protein [Clavibacter michiganensis]